MDIEIIKKNQSYLLSEHGIIVNDVVVEGVEVNDIYTSKEGIHGRFLLNSTFSKRKISVPVHFKVDKYSSYQRVRDLLYELVTDSEPFYIRELRRIEKPNYEFKQAVADDPQLFDESGNPIYSNRNYENHYVTGKQYLVKLAGVITPNQKGRKGEATIDFETAELPFAESIGTSLQLEENDTLGLWSTDMRISHSVNATRQYTFKNVKNGSVYYHGTTPLDQFNMHCIVEVTIGEPTTELNWYLRHSDLMVIKGLSLIPGDVIRYDGMHTYKNGININRYTRLTSPKFKPGHNAFNFNQTVLQVTFDMKFYYV